MITMPYRNFSGVFVMMSKKSVISGLFLAALAAPVHAGQWVIEESDDNYLVEYKNESPDAPAPVPAGNRAVPPMTAPVPGPASQVAPTAPPAEQPARNRETSRRERAPRAPRAPDDEGHLD